MSGEHGTRAQLIRLALGPDGSIAPDLFAKAPGRGAWIGVSGEELTKAQEKGKLAGLLRRAFKTDKIDIIDDLSGRIDRGLEKAFLDRLGLGSAGRAPYLGCREDRFCIAQRAGPFASACFRCQRRRQWQARSGVARW